MCVHVCVFMGLLAVAAAVGQHMQHDTACSGVMSSSGAAGAVLLPRCHAAAVVPVS